MQKLIDCSEYFVDATLLQEIGGDSQFAAPGGPAAFAVAWEIVTTEKEPRVILAYPSPSDVDALGERRDTSLLPR